MKNTYLLTLACLMGSAIFCVHDDEFNIAHKLVGLDPDHEFLDHGSTEIADNPAITDENNTPAEAHDCTPAKETCPNAEEMCSNCELKQILSLLPPELAKRLSEEKNHDYHFEQLATAFFCVNQSLNHKQRNVVCGGIFDHIPPSTTDKKWDLNVEYHVRELLWDERNPFKKAELINQAVDALHAYREQTTPPVAIAQEEKEAPLNEIDEAYQRED